MKRITEEQAKMYVPYQDDLTNAEKEFFTLTQNPIDPEWEDVKYYTSRKGDIYGNREGEGDSWVYVLSNVSMPNLIKIGSTTKAPEERAKQISRGTGVPTNFDVEFAFRCFNAEALERELHKFFKSSRTSNDREFFHLSSEEATQAINLLGKRYI